MRRTLELAEALRLLDDDGPIVGAMTTTVVGLLAYFRHRGWV